ncbi:putative disease resistance protein RGA4 isoform X2 [Elaeis guineensis]|uniref:disease resistance protein RGA2-like n=1 Tax=Elaeis guineensis var. tenera TaxID=51953 RepID=A0A6J0PSS7_ELAGV|nr:disease resistance protein RGA2-like [Elaeis guineensis]XP_019711200.1 disease resistance protein RGA2-like [Elaeis guineensis]XP_029116204.1 disease resistance protein RGA2-like [Elaeis guineensis]
MANTLVSSILSKSSQILGSFQRWAVSPSSSSDPRSKIMKDLKKLERTLTRIQAVLHDAEEREICEKAINLWLKELKEVAYEAEDVLDEYRYEELRAQVEGRAFRKRKRAEADDEEEVSGSPSTIVVSIPDGMGNRIREIRERFDEISEDRERLRLREEDGERRVLGAVYPAPTSHMVEESSIYGREHDKQKVIDLLFSEGTKKGISVIPIVGKGGLGKTTIAQLVYNDSQVKECFDLTGWVCVSDDFNVIKLTKDIIESITQQSCDLTLLSTLQNTLEANVKGKKVLLVLDDVWNEQRSLWESLRRPFVLGAGTVRIIVTCRNDSVAEIMQTVQPYHPDYLSEDKSWLLFKHYAFGGRDSEEQSRLAEVGKQIVKKCSNLPLAVKTIGSLLREMRDEDSWKDVLQSDLWEVDRNYNETLAALRISYTRMPAHLKPCFVYCSMFPKDYVFDKDVLVRLWMAQGYIPLRDRRTMEEIGNEYFSDLQRRSFFDSGRPFYMQTKRLILDSDEMFKMHDLIHDLAKSIAENECCTIVDRSLPSFFGMVRHLYMEDKKELVKSLCSHDLGALRTLLLEGWNGRNKRIMVPEHYARTLVSQGHMTDLLEDWLRGMAIGEVPPLLTHFPPPLLRTRCLRTLQIDWESEDELPNSIDNLKHLRYLHVRSHCIKRLPKSVCLLYHLQTLILDGSRLEELPDGLGNLTELRYFELHSYVIKRLPELVCRLHNLRTLKLFCPHLVELPCGLSNLTNLQDFELWSNVVTSLPGSICQLPNLQILDIGLCMNLVELPSGIGSLPNLRFLNTAGTGIHCPPVGIEKLTILWTLHGREIVRGRIGVLKDLHIQGTILISGLRNLVNIEDARDANLKCKHGLQCLSLAWNGQHDHQFLSLGGALRIEASPEENKDVPVDEKREEAMLEYLQPHANLRNLHIVGYGGSKFPKWVGNPFSFASLQEISINGCENIRSLPLYIHDSLGKLDEPMPQSVLERVHILSCRQLTSIAGLHNLHSLKYLRIYDCPQLGLLSEEGLPSTLETLSIGECQQLTSSLGMQNLTSLRQLIIKSCPIVGLHNLHSLKYLRIYDCPQLRLLTVEGLPSTLEMLSIGECQQLTSLLGMKNLTSLKELSIKNCPKLHIMAENQLSSMQKCDFVKVVSGNKMAIISNTWERIKHEFDPTEHRNPMKRFLSSTYELLTPRISAPVLEELTVWSCELPVRCLKWYWPWLRSLRRLVIKDCCTIRYLPDVLLAYTLKSLVVDSCENLESLKLTHKNRDVLEELQVVNCPKFVVLEGLNHLIFLKFLRIKQCPQLQPSQDDWLLPSTHPHVEIEGVLETKFYPPHSGHREQRNN